MRDPIPAYVHLLRAKDLIDRSYGEPLLRATDASVTEISLEVGFRSLGSFSTAFRALAGEPPSRYRAAWRERAEPAVPGCHTLMWTRPAERALFEKRPGPAGDSVAA